jgi:hypothetical protein
MDIAGTIDACCGTFHVAEGLSGDIGIGVNPGIDSYCSWAVMHLQSGTCTGLEELATPATSPLELEKVTLQLCGSAETWASLTDATAAAISDAVDTALLTIEGDLPLFIRFADSFIVLIGCVAKEFASSLGSRDALE